MARNPIVSGAERSQLRAEMREAYEGGMTVKAVAAKFSRSYGTTQKLLHEAGTPMRSRGGKP